MTFIFTHLLFLLRKNVHLSNLPGIVNKNSLKSEKVNRDYQQLQKGKCNSTIQPFDQIKSMYKTNRSPTIPETKSLSK